jgi:hypothetical protein
LSIILPKKFKKIAHNVPVVYDGLTARKSKTAGFAGPANCAGTMAWEWSVA